MKLTLSRASGVALYRQVAEQVRKLIRSGALPPGSRLPTVRALAGELKLTRLTVQSAYAELQTQGYVEAVVGRGTFVAERPPGPAGLRGGSANGARSVPQPPSTWLVQGVLAELVSLAQRDDILSFAQAIPAPETYPLRELKRMLAAAMDDPAAMSYGPIQGDPALREQVSRLLLDRGVVAPREDVLITAGAQQAIAVALHALTVPDDVVLVEEPAYPGIIELAARRGQRVVGVPRDGEGPATDALEAACAAHRPRLLYTVPTFHNPTGLSMSQERRADLLRIAAAYDALIVEDDTYGFLAFDAPAPSPLRAEDAGGERVLYITSFSKALAPGLRLGALVASPRHLPALAGAKHDIDLLCPPANQRALAEYLRRGAFTAHVRSVQELYRERRDALLSALSRHLPGCSWTHPAGGLNLWVTLPEGTPERDFFFEALEHGVGFARGQAFFAAPHACAHMRVSFGALPPAQIHEGVRRLGEALREFHRHRADAAVRATRESTPLV